MRVRILGIIIFILTSLLVAGLFYLQVIKGPVYQRLSTQNRIRLVPIESPRGRIFDRNGRVLVDNKICFDVAIIPQELDDKEDILNNLSQRLELSKESLEGALKNNFVTPFQPIIVASVS